MSMTSAQYLRYSRHLILPEVGVEGQKKLLSGRVLVIGGGGLGSPAALYLAAAGVGTIGIVDFDTVDASNLQRQVLYDTAQVGLPKVAMAARRLNALNPDVKVVQHFGALDSTNALRLFKGYDYIIDGTDNFQTRYLVNDACLLSGKINVYGSIFRFDGQATVFGAQGGPCYRCLFPVPPEPGEVPNCAEGGVLGVLAGLIGLLQATETIKLITGIGEPLIGRLLLLDVLGMKWREMKIKRNPECAACGDHRSLNGLIDYEAFCGMAGREDRVNEIESADLRQQLELDGKVFLLDVREREEHVARNIPGSRHIPVNELIERISELESCRDQEIVVYCHRGVRSQSAVRILQARGFDKVVSLRDGIVGWFASESEGDAP